MGYLEPDQTPRSTQIGMSGCHDILAGLEGFEPKDGDGEVRTARMPEVPRATARRTSLSSSLRIGAALYVPLSI